MQESVHDSMRSKEAPERDGNRESIRTGWCESRLYTRGNKGSKASQSFPLNS